MKGKIKKYNAFRGFGFIESDELKDDVFFHISNYPKFTIPLEGQEVNFELIETFRGNEAKQIEVIKNI
jgi:cold shock CspA family protein